MRNNVTRLMYGVMLAMVFMTPLWADADIMDDGQIIDVTMTESGDMVDDQENAMDAIAAAAVSAYDVNGTLFQRITSLEEEKVIMQLEKERAQMELELDRLAAERIKLQMELDTLSGRAEQQQQEFENQRAKLEAEAARLAKEKERLERDVENAANRAVSDYVNQSNTPDASDDSTDPVIDSRYRLVNVIGAGNQLQATIEDLNNGQQRRISVGKTVDGFTVSAISLDDGVVFVKGDKTQTLNIGGAN